MAKKVPTILEDCLQRLDRGENLAEVLADFPDRTEELKSLLLVAMASRAFPVPVPSQAAQRLGRNQMLAEMNSLEIKQAFRKNSSIPSLNRLITALVIQTRSRGLNRLAYSYRLATVLMILIFSGGFFTFQASASSRPGDLFYFLRLGLEKAGWVVPEQVELPEQFTGLFGLGNNNIGIRAGQLLEIQGEGANPHDSFPGSDQGALASADGRAQQELAEEERELREAEREEEKDLKDAEKEVEKDLKETEKETEEDLKEADDDLKKSEMDSEEEYQEFMEDEKDLKEVEKDAEEELREEEKEIEAVEKETGKDQKVEEKELKHAEKDNDKNK